MMGAPRLHSPRARYYQRYTLQYLKENILLVCLALLYLLGAFGGSWAMRRLEPTQVEGLMSILTGFVVERSAQAIEQTMTSAFLSSFWIVAFLFICGFCAISTPLILLTPLFRGLGYGLTAASMLGLYGREALPYIGCLLLPGAVASALVILLACKESLGLSGVFWGLLRGERGEGGVLVSSYLMRFALLVGLLALSAALEGALFATFAGTFTPIG